MDNPGGHTRSHSEGTSNRPSYTQQAFQRDSHEASVDAGQSVDTEMSARPVTPETPIISVTPTNGRPPSSQDNRGRRATLPTEAALGSYLRVVDKDVKQAKRDQSESKSVKSTMTIDSKLSQGSKDSYVPDRFERIITGTSNLQNLERMETRIEDVLRIPVEQMSVEKFKDCFSRICGILRESEFSAHTFKLMYERQKLKDTNEEDKKSIENGIIGHLLSFDAQNTNKWNEYKNTIIDALNDVNGAGERIKETFGSASLNDMYKRINNLKVGIEEKSEKEAKTETEEKRTKIGQSREEMALEKRVGRIKIVLNAIKELKASGDTTQALEEIEISKGLLKKEEGQDKLDIEKLHSALNEKRNQILDGAQRTLDGAATVLGGLMQIIEKETKANGTQEAIEALKFMSSGDAKTLLEGIKTLGGGVIDTTKGIGGVIGELMRSRKKLDQGLKIEEGKLTIEEGELTIKDRGATSSKGKEGKLTIKDRGATSSKGKETDKTVKLTIKPIKRSLTISDQMDAINMVQEAVKSNNVTDIERGEELLKNALKEAEDALKLERRKSQYINDITTILVKAWIDGRSVIVPDERVAALWKNMRDLQDRIMRTPQSVIDRMSVYAYTQRDSQLRWEEVQGNKMRAAWLTMNTIGRTAKTDNNRLVARGVVAIYCGEAEGRLAAQERKYGEVISPKPSTSKSLGKYEFTTRNLDDAIADREIAKSSRNFNTSDPRSYQMYACEQIYLKQTEINEATDELKKEVSLILYSFKKISETVESAIKEYSEDTKGIPQNQNHALEIMLRAMNVNKTLISLNTFIGQASAEESIVRGVKDSQGKIKQLDNELAKMIQNYPVPPSEKNVVENTTFMTEGLDDVQKIIGMTLALAPVLW